MAANDSALHETAAGEARHIEASTRRDIRFRQLGPPAGVVADAPTGYDRELMTPAYLDPASRQTLREGLAEYYAINAGLLDPAGLADDAAEMFRRHDAGHVVFGCDTSLRGEIQIDTWTVLATSAGLRGYLEYFRYPQVNQIFAESGMRAILAATLRGVPDVLRILVRAWRMPQRWPWESFEDYLDLPLGEIRACFGIRPLQPPDSRAGR